MLIRAAEERHIPGLIQLLKQVGQVPIWDGRICSGQVPRNTIKKI